jgi:hypothetical protein
MPGVDRKVRKEVDAHIPGSANIRIRDVIVQPGASTPVMTMDHDMVCETTEGTLEATKDGQPFPAPQGPVWTCRKGGTDMTTNQGSTVAIMHVIDRLPASGGSSGPATPQGHASSRGAAEAHERRESPRVRPHHTCPRASWHRQHVSAFRDPSRVACPHTSVPVGASQDAPHHGASPHPRPQRSRGAARRRGTAASEPSTGGQGFTAGQMQTDGAREDGEQTWMCSRAAHRWCIHAQ